MTNIALVSEHASPLATLGGVDAGGQNVYVAHLARALGVLGHQVVVFTRRDDPSLPECVPMAPNVVVVHLRAGPPRPVDKDDLFPLMDEFADGLRRGLFAHRTEVVHAHFWMAGYASLAAAAPAGIPVVQTFHALGTVERRHQCIADTSPPERDAVERRLLHEVDRVIATCSDEHRELESLGCRGDRVSIVPAGFDGAIFHPRPDVRWFEVDRGKGPVQLVAVSRLVPRKGLGDVVRSVAELPDTRLTVIGGPPAGRLFDDSNHRDLRDLAVALDASARIRFTGGLPPGGVAELLRAADLFVAAPWYEPIGIAPVEAMGCGVPVVGTAVGGLLDIVVDGGTGTLVPPRDPVALASAIDMLARQPELRHELGARAAWRAHRRFTWPVVARAVADVYRRTLVGRVGRECRA
jgi:D-inositol-3-phosphate glycosyltransferase